MLYLEVQYSEMIIINNENEIKSQLNQYFYIQTVKKMMKMRLNHN